MSTTIRRRKAIALGLAMGALTSPTLAGHGWAQLRGASDRTGRILVPFAAGGMTDFVARVVAEILDELTGRSFVIENRAGARGDVSAEIVARAAPDGRTLLLGTVNTAVTNQYLHKYVPYDSAESFAPVALVGEVANVLVVHPSFPARSLEDLVDRCKALGINKASYGSPGVGSPGHLAMEYLQCQAGIKLAHVAYRGRTAMMNDLLAGRVLIAMDTLPTYLSHIQSGALRAMAVSSACRWFAAPDVPTVAEHGYGDFDATLWWYVAAPAATPRDMIKSLSAAIVKGIKSEPVILKFRSIGASARPGDAEELFMHIAAENAKWKRVITMAGLGLQ